jgi:hypothetical protein
MGRAGILSESVATGYKAACEHCGNGVEVVVVPQEGKEFIVPRSALDQLVRLASRLDRMQAKMIYIQRTKTEQNEGSLNSREGPDHSSTG